MNGRRGCVLFLSSATRKLDDVDSMCTYMVCVHSSLLTIRPRTQIDSAGRSTDNRRHLANISAINSAVPTTWTREWEELGLHRGVSHSRTAQRCRTCWNETGMTSRCQRGDELETNDSYVCRCDVQMEFKFKLMDRVQMESVERQACYLWSKTTILTDFIHWLFCNVTMDVNKSYMLTYSLPRVVMQSAV